MFLVLALAAGIPFSYEGSLRPGQTLSVQDLNGSIMVRAGDRLTIRATKRSARGEAQDVTIRTDQTAKGLAVCVRYPGYADRRCDQSASGHDVHNDTIVDFDITLPAGVSLEAGTVNGSVDAQTDGPIVADTVNGNVRVAGRDVRSVHTVNGSVQIRVRDRSRNDLEAKTVNGSIKVELPSGSGVTVDAKTLTGNISAEGVTVSRPRYGPGATASGTIGDGARRVTLETVNGSITLTR